MAHMRLLISLIAISSLTVFTGSILAPFESRFLLSIVHDPRIVGIIFAVSSIAFGILAYYLSSLSDRHGRRSFILAGLSVGILYPLWYAGIHGALAAYGIKIAWAFSAVAAGPVLSAYIQDVINDMPNKGTIFGYLYSAQSIAGSAGALLGGWLAQHYGLSTPFYALSAASALSFALAFTLLPRDSGHVHDESASKTFGELLSYIGSKPQLVFYFALNTSFGINWGIKAFLWPLAVYDIAQSDLATGSIFATMGAVAFLLLPFAGKIVDRYGAYRISLVQFALLGTSGVCMALSHSLTLFWVMAAVYTIGEVLNLSQSVIITEHVPSSFRGQFVGFDAVMDRALNSIAPFAAGFLLTVYSTSTVLLIFMLLYWASLACAWHVYRARIAPLPRS